MSCTLSGKWMMIEFNNAEQYYSAIGCSKMFIEKMRHLANAISSDPDEFYVEELVVDSIGKMMHRVVHQKGEADRHSGLIVFGKEVDHVMPDGRVTRAVLRLELNSVMVLDMRCGSIDSVATINLLPTGDELYVEMVCGSVMCTERYKRLK